MTVHRGRTKKGKTTVMLYLSTAEVAALDKLAEQELRSRTGQATWIVLTVLVEAQDADPA